MRMTPLPAVFHGDGTASIPLQRFGEVVAYALVDADLADELAIWGWRLHSKGYASRGEQRDGRSVDILLHREVLGLAHGIGHSAGVGDHLDRNTLNCTRTNLRVKSNALNCANRGGEANANSQSGTLGVSWNGRASAWEANVWRDRRKYFLGYFPDLDTADRVATAGRLLLFGTPDGSIAPTYDSTTPTADVRAHSQEMALTLEDAAEATDVLPSASWPVNGRCGAVSGPA